jgi:DNA polymerase (family X)
VASPFAGNIAIADELRAVADLLSARQASPYRVAAYRRAADRVQTLLEDVQPLVEARGAAALKEFGIDGDLAATIGERASTGRFPLLARLRGAPGPDEEFARIPGVGPALAQKIFATLGVDSLPSLATAARQGRLARVPGIGPRRAAAITAWLAQSRAGDDAPAPVAGEPDVATLLDVDAEYRRRAAAGELPLVTPRRMNATNARWLPILRTQRGGWSFSVMFSNTPRAHALGRTGDWVLVYFSDDGRRSRERTVVTETRGLCRGKRIVRGREDECLRVVWRSDESSTATALPNAT